MTPGGHDRAVLQNHLPSHVSQEVVSHLSLPQVTVLSGTEGETWRLVGVTSRLFLAWSSERQRGPVQCSQEGE